MNCLKGLSAWTVWKVCQHEQSEMSVIMNSVKGVSVNTLWTVCQNEQSERSVSMNSLICPSLRSYFVRHIFNTRVLRFCFIRSVNSFCNWVASAIKRKKVLGGSGAQNVSSSELGPLPGWRTDFVHSFREWLVQDQSSVIKDFFPDLFWLPFFFTSYQVEVCSLSP